MPPFAPGHVSPLPEFQVLVAFNDRPFVDPNTLNDPGPDVLGGQGQWTHIGKFVDRITVRRGRQHELQRFESGVCTIEAKNDDGIFNPWNTESPFAPDRPPQGCPFRVQAVYGGTTYEIFTGHLHSVKPKFEDNFTSTVTLQASDLFRILAWTNIFEHPLTLHGAYPYAVLADHPTNYWRLNEILEPTAHDLGSAPNDGTFKHVVDLGGTPPAPGVGNGSIGNPGAFTSSDPNSRSMFTGSIEHQALVKMNSPQPVPQPPFTIEFWIKPMANLTGDYAFQVRTASGDSVGVYVEQLLGVGGSIPEQRLGVSVFDIGVGQRNVRTAAMHLGFGGWLYCVATCDNIDNFHLYVNGTEQVQDIAVPSGTPSISGSGDGWIAFSNNFSGLNAVYLEEVAVYNYALSPLQVNAHWVAAGLQLYQLSAQPTGARINGVLDFIGWPYPARDVDAGSVFVQELPVQDLTTTKALAHMQLAEMTEDGALFMTKDGKVKFISNPNMGAPPYSEEQATFTDGGGINVRTYNDLDVSADDTDLANNATVQFQEPFMDTPVTARDPASEEKYGPRSVPGNYTSLIGNNVTDAYYLAARLVAKYRAPKTRLKQITIKPLDDPAILFEEVLQRELNDRIFVQRLGPPVPGHPLLRQFGVPLEIEANVTQIEHTITAKDWTVKYGLADTIPPTDFADILLPELPDAPFDP